MKNGVEMEKKIVTHINSVIILLVVLFVTSELYSQERLSAPNRLYSDQEFIFTDNNEFSVDSLNTKLTTADKERYKYDSPYSSVEFIRLNERQIDSIIAQIEKKKYINWVSFTQCPIKRLPYSIRHLKNTIGITFYECDSISSMNGFNSVFSTFNIRFFDCRISRLPEGVERLMPMLKLTLEFPNDFSGFDLNRELKKFGARKNILDLFVKYQQLREFPKSLFELTALQNLIFLCHDSVKVAPNFDKLINLIYADISFTDDEAFNSILKVENLNFASQSSFYQGEDERTIEFRRSKIMHYQMKLIGPKESVEFFWRRGASKYKLNGYEVSLIPDTANLALKIHIANVTESDSVKIVLANPDREFPELFALDYQKQQNTIYLKNLPESNYQYSLLIYINDKVKKWILYFPTDKPRIERWD